MLTGSINDLLHELYNYDVTDIDVRKSNIRGVVLTNIMEVTNNDDCTYKERIKSNLKIYIIFLSVIAILHI